MNTDSDEQKAGPGSSRAGEARPVHPDGRLTLPGRDRSQSAAATDRPDEVAGVPGVPGAPVAPGTPSTPIGKATIDLQAADHVRPGSEQQRAAGATSRESRQTPETVLADGLALKSIERQHDWLQGLPAGSLGVRLARAEATTNVAALSNFADATLQGRAAAVMGETAQKHPDYKAQLAEVSTQYADLASRRYAEELQRSAAKDDRKSAEFAGRRDDAADRITTRYATMAGAGLSVKDLQGPAVVRLAIQDGHDLALVDGHPPHRRIDEVKALVADSLKSDGYRAALDRELAEWATPSVGRQPGLAAHGAAHAPIELSGAAPAPAAAVKPLDATSTRTPQPTSRSEPERNSMRSVGNTIEKHRAIPPLEDRFNVKRVGLVQKAYHFRDQTGKVAFTDKFLSITTASESPAAVKAMVDRAAERGWTTVGLKGSQEFVRQGWIAATAQGLKAVGHTPSLADREAAAKEQVRLQVSQEGLPPQRYGETARPVRSEQVEREAGQGQAAHAGGQRQLAIAIEKALLDGKVSPELRGQVRALMAAEGLIKEARGERFKLPVYDASSPRAQAKSVQAGPQRQGDRERSR